MIRVQKIQDGVFTVIIDGDMLATMKYIVDRGGYTSEEFIYKILHGVLRLDNNNVFLKGLSNGMD